MLVKWITCAATDRAGFDRGQRSWAGLRDVPGFLGQGGGWSTRDPDRAHVFGFWADAAGYQAFMDGPHDDLATAQADSYTGMVIRLLHRGLDIGRPVQDVLGAGSVLRIAHCFVHSGRLEHFQAAQAQVWNPGMVAAPGMLGGVFAKAAGAEFLVLSAWASLVDHENYRTERFPDLNRRAGANEDLAEITGELIAIAPQWTVMPAR